MLFTHERSTTVYQTVVRSGIFEKKSALLLQHMTDGSFGHLTCCAYTIDILFSDLPPDGCLMIFW